MSRLLLLRHGQSTWNAEHRWQGWADPPLSPLGERQAGAAARWLATWSERFAAAVVSSDLVRARRTAEVLAEGLGLGPVEVDADLRERDVGDWTGLTTGEIGSRWPAVLAEWRAGRLVATPGGEPEPALVARVLAGLSRLAARHGAGEAVLVITHGGAIRALERRFGIEPNPLGLGNLCGRWIEFDGPDPRAGPAVTLPALDEDTVAIFR
ncbi:MAG: histidine phosphatase family protein [Acidimicrobiales bacterium]